MDHNTECVDIQFNQSQESWHDGRNLTLSPRQKMNGDKAASFALHPVPTEVQNEKKVLNPPTMHDVQQNTNVELLPKSRLQAKSYRMLGPKRFDFLDMIRETQKKITNEFIPIQKRMSLPFPNSPWRS